MVFQIVINDEFFPFFLSSFFLRFFLFILYIYIYIYIYMCVCVCVCVYVVGPCHHGMARPQVADRGTASDKEGSCE